MKRVEISYRANLNELEKLNQKLERAEKALAKKLAVAQKLGVSEWSKEEHYEWLRNVPTQDGWIINKADVRKNGAWFDLFCAEREVEDIKERIANAEKRFSKVEQALDEYHQELEKIDDLKRKEEMFKLEFEQEQREWAKDGITLERRYMGITPQGKRFWIDRNNGFTERSLHCFTLYLDGSVIFTSGEFWRAYGVIKNS